MEMFPILNNGHVALIRADKNTGHVLDVNFKIALTDDQKVFTVFESLDEAKVIAEKISKTNSGVEVVIYSSSQEVAYRTNI